MPSLVAARSIASDMPGKGTDAAVLVGHIIHFRSSFRFVPTGLFVCTCSAAQQAFLSSTWPTTDACIYLSIASHHAQVSYRSDGGVLGEGPPLPVAAIGSSVSLDIRNSRVEARELTFFSPPIENMHITSWSSILQLLVSPDEH